MKNAAWTILLVPPTNEPPRSVRLTRIALRALGAVAAVTVLLVVGAALVLFTPWGTPGGRLVAAENAALKRDIAAYEARFQVLQDTLGEIARREQQMRLLAGIEPDSAATDAASLDASSADSALLASSAERDGGSGINLAGMTGGSARKRPFLGRLGWSSRPDIDGLIERASNLARNFRDVSDTLQRNFDRLASTPSIMPTSGWLSSQFSKSRFHPILHRNRPHEGIDVTAPTGTPIVAPASGRVVLAGIDNGYGLTVEIDHGNGIRTRFAHCSRLSVRKGQQVTRGEMIAAVGSTGLSTAPHLHYEIHVNGKPVNPLSYVLPDALP